MSKYIRWWGLLRTFSNRYFNDNQSVADALVARITKARGKVTNQVTLNSDSATTTASQTGGNYDTLGQFPANCFTVVVFSTRISLFHTARSSK